MNARLPIDLVLVLALVVCLAATRPLAAGQVYRWRDPTGQVHFSDTPPADGATVEEIDPGVEPDTSAPPASEVDYSIEAQARRMQSERLDREARRRDAEMQQQEEQIRSLEQRVRDAEQENARLQREQQDVESYPPPVYRYPRHRHPYPDWDGGYPRPRPVPPIHPPHPPPPPPAPPPEHGRGRVLPWRGAQ